MAQSVKSLDLAFVRPVSAFLWLMLFCFFSPSTAASQYRFDVMNTDTGLPQNSVLSILQSRGDLSLGAGPCKSAILVLEAPLS